VLWLAKQLPVNTIDTRKLTSGQLPYLLKHQVAAVSDQM
jgi:hypothetical protein